MNGSAALKLIRTNGVGGLGGYDGCLCTNFEVQGVCVDVSCRKSCAGINAVAPDFYGVKVRVYSRHMDRSIAELEQIAREVAKQLQCEGYAIMVRYCDYEHDSKQLCTYCDKPRQDPKGYLCSECLVKPGVFGGKVADDYDLRRFDFIVPASDEG